MSKDFIRWTGLHNFLEAERTAFAEKMNYFFCEFTEVVGELEYPVSFILRCPNSVNAAHRYDEFSLTIAMVGKKMPKEGYNLVLALPSKNQYETNHS
ncbi:hypothetical protein M8494_33255 (plasmid) [Serratia ureilytica]